jgi:DNA-binding FadR family transcriptional regulator
MRTPRGRNLTYSMVESLGQSIVTGEYDSRPFPTEAELARQFGASRSVTREAVKMLTAKGLLRARQRQGTSVEPEAYWNLLDPEVLRWLLERKFSLKLLSDFTEVRLAIEPMAAALAAKNADRVTLSELQHGIDRMHAAAKGEDDPLAADIAFHAAVLNATNNPFYAQLRGLVNTALRISIRYTNRIKGRTASVPAHEKVFDAIVARDAKAASDAMRAIIVEVQKLIESGVPAPTAKSSKPARRKSLASR